MRPPKAIRCSRCSRRCRRLDRWNVVFQRGYVVGFLCPDCQTAEEYAEAEINEAVLDYSRSRLDNFGRTFTPTKH